jgi:hypothetical protein
MDEVIAEQNPRRRQRSKRRRHGRKRKNPEMLAIGNPKRKRRGRRAKRSFSFSMKARRNPGFGGKIPILGYPVASLLYLAVGATGTSFLSGMVVKWVPFLQPTLVAGVGQPNMFERAKPYIVDLVAAFATSKLGGMVFKSRQAETEILTGGLAVPLLRLLRTEVFPRLGLSGPDDFEEEDFGGMGYFVDNGFGRFAPEDVSPRRGMAGWSDELGGRRARNRVVPFMN